MLNHNKDFEPFADGYVTIYDIVNIAAAGDRPRDGLRKKIKLPYDYLTVGIRRQLIAAQEDVRIDMLISAPFHKSVSTQDAAVLDGVQYTITDIKRIRETRPVTMRISLRKVAEKYEIENTGL